MEAEAVRAKSEAIGRYVLSIPIIDEALSVLTYIGAKNNEVETLGLIEELLARECRVCVPVVVSQHEMEWAALSSTDTLARTELDLLEPAASSRTMVAPPMEAPVLVPGLVFTRYGGRMGFGGGFYDNFLARHEGPSIGLAYEWQLRDFIPEEPQDERVDYVVTEERVIRCG